MNNIPKLIIANGTKINLEVSTFSICAAFVLGFPKNIIPKILVKAINTIEPTKANIAIEIIIILCRRI